MMTPELLLLSVERTLQPILAENLSRSKIESQHHESEHISSLAYWKGYVAAIVAKR